MPIYRAAQGHAFDPDEIAVLVQAFDAACISLGIEEGDIASAELIARQVVDCAMDGERDPLKLSAYAVAKMRAPVL